MRAKLAILMLLPLSLAACGEMKEGFDKGVEEKFVKEFVDSCTTSAVKAGGPAALASKMCRCTVDKLAAKHKGSALLSVSEEEMMAAGNQCIQEQGQATK